MCAAAVVPPSHIDFAKGGNLGEPRKSKGFQRGCRGLTEALGACFGDEKKNILRNSYMEV